jgi:hypothetical protein
VAAGAGMEERVAALMLVNDELKHRLDAQADSAKGIETKAVILIGFAATAIQFLVSHNHRPVWAAFASAAYGIAFATGLWAIRLRHFKAVPEPAFLGAKYEAALAANNVAIREYLLVSLVGTRVDTFAKNDAKIVTKARSWWLSLFALAAGVVLSVVALTGVKSHAGQPAHPPAGRAVHSHAHS